MNEKEFEAIIKLVEYLEHDEKKHYLESEPANRKNHIYIHVKRVKKWINSNPFNV